MKQEKYHAKAKEMEDELLKSFLRETNEMNDEKKKGKMRKIQTQAYAYYENETDVREPILKQMELLGNEIKSSIIKEMLMEQMRREKIKPNYKRKAKLFKLKADTPLKLGDGIKSEGSTFLMHGRKMSRFAKESVEPVLDNAFKSKIERVISEKALKSKQESNKKEILSQVLDEGRPNFLKTDKILARCTQQSSPKKLVNCKSGNIPLALTLESQMIPQNDEAVKRAVLNIRSAKGEKSKMPPERPKTRQEKMENLAKRQEEMREEFICCQEFQELKNTGKQGQTSTRKSKPTREIRPRSIQSARTRTKKLSKKIEPNLLSNLFGSPQQTSPQKREETNFITLFNGWSTHKEKSYLANVRNNIKA